MYLKFADKSIKAVSSRLTIHHIIQSSDILFDNRNRASDEWFPPAV